MTKVNRRILLWIVSFLALVCFGLALNVGVAPVAKAEGTLSIKSITQTYAQPYNSTHPDGSKYQYTSLYTIDFDQEISELSNYSVGEEVTALFENFTAKTKFGVNGKSLSEMSHMSAKLFKIDADSVELSVYRPVFWTQIVFAEGITVGNFELTPSNWYEQSDWTFTNEVPTEFKIMAVYEKNLASEVNATYVNLRFAFNMKGHIVNASALKGITINGESIYTSETVSATTVNTNVAVAGSSGVYYGNDWDSPGNQDVYIRVPKTALANGATITFPVGFTLDKNSLKTAQTFSIGVADRTVMTEQPVWAEDGEDVGGGDEEEILPLAIESITQTYAQPYNGNHPSGTKYKYTSLYTIDFDQEIALLDSYGEGEEVTALFENFTAKTKFGANGKSLSEMSHMSAKLFKIDADSVELSVYRPVFCTQIVFVKGITVGNFELTPSNWYEQSDWTFTNEAPTELKIMAVYEKNLANEVNATYVNLRFAFNMKGHIVNASALKGITINGESIYTSETVSETTVNTNVAVASASGVYHGNDWDSPGYQDAYIRVPKTALANGATITFPVGFTLDKNSLKTAQTFSIGVADRTVMTEQPVWVELPMQTVNYKVGDSVISTVKDTVITLADPATIDGYNSEKTFIGWTDGEKLYKAGTIIKNLTVETTFTAVEIGSFAQAAPEVRTFGTAGVRFVTTFNTEDYALYEGKFFTGFGTIIARSADLTANNEALADVLTKDTTSVIVKLDSTVQATKGELTYVRGGIMEMYAHNFDKELVGAGYIAVEYATGVEYIVTSEAKVVVKDVALSILSDIANGEASEEDFDMNLINAYAGINA